VLATVLEEPETAQSVLERLVSLSTERNAVWKRIKGQHSAHTHTRKFTTTSKDIADCEGH